jgi:hypothetical protein
MIDFQFGIGRKVSNIQSQKVREIRDQKKLFDFKENDHLIEFQLIEIVFYHLIEIMLIT